MKSVVWISASVFLYGCVVVPVPLPAPAVQDQPTRAAASPATSTASFTDLINTYRADQGRGALQQSQALTRAAQAHAEDMVARGYFAHDAPNGPNGVTFSQRAISAGCAMRVGAENIATGQRTEQAVIDAWDSSAGHKRNMLGARYTQYGIGRAGDIWVLKLAAAC
ncbi:MAG: CAP domain-containing protein [Pseudomonadota bacterium]